MNYMKKKERKRHRTYLYRQDHQKRIKHRGYNGKKKCVLTIKIFKILILLLISILLFIFRYQFIFIYDDKISIIINMKSLTKEKHLYFNNILMKLNSTRNFYFIQSIGQQLNDTLSELLGNSTIKLVQSNFPDSIFLPLIVSLYGETVPEFVLFIEGDDLFNINENKLINWINNAYLIIKGNAYDYIFGNSQIIDGKKIGCSILLSKSSVIQHLLYNTDSDTTHINPFIQLSLATQTTFIFIPFKNIKVSNLQNINGKFSININCPLINDNSNPSLCIMLPTFKRNYFSLSMPAYASQTYKPKFYVIIQNTDRMHFNMSFVQNMTNETVYHIWIQNWNSFFFLNHRLASIFPCDLILKYDDDQWPKDVNLQKNLIDNIKNNNIIIGQGDMNVKKSMCGYTAENYIIRRNNISEHVGVPLLIRTNYLKVDARNKPFKIYGAEDVALSLNSNRLCNVTSIVVGMNLIQKQIDGNSQSLDKQIVSQIEKDRKKDNKFNLFIYFYCYLIRSGYIPRRWENFHIPKKDSINITVNHKSLY